MQDLDINFEPARVELESINLMETTKFSLTIVELHFTVYITVLVGLVG